MSVLTKRLSASPHYSRMLEWSKLVAITGSAQLFIQAIGLVSGILVIRLLPTEQYALYTLANTMLGTIIVVADGGIATGVMATGGRLWQDRRQLGVAIATGLDLRRKFAALVLLAAVPILLLLLYRHSHDWLLAGLIVASLIPTFLAALSGTLLEIAPRLHQDIKSLQKIEVASNFGRLLLMVPLLLVFPWSYVALVSAGIPQLWANRQLRKVSAAYADWTQPPDPVVRQEIFPIVKRVLPGTLYYSVSGQITVWLISVFGSTVAVAQVGALGRLAMVLGLFSVMFATLITPRFARLPNDKSLLLGRFIQAQLLLLVIIIGATLFIYLFPAQVLALLGKKYSNLKIEAILMVFGSCLSMAGGISYSIAVARGWILPPIINIGVNVLVQILLLLLLNISVTKNVLIFSAATSAVAYSLYVFYFLFKVHKLKRI